MPLSDSDILPLIPARGGSTVIPHKNIRRLPDGTTLLSRAVSIAQTAFGWAVVSTDDKDIATAAEKLGASVVFRQTAGDGPMWPVVAEAVELFPSTSAVMLLQPTAPLRSDITVCQALDLLDGGATSVVSVSPIPAKYSSLWRLRIASGKLLTERGDWGTLPSSRQMILLNEYVRDGVCYYTRCATVRQGTLYGDRVIPLLTPENERLNIDDWNDWAVLEARLR